MKRLLPFAFLVTLLTGYAVGTVTSQSAAAQAPAGPAGAYPSYPGGVIPPAQKTGTAMFWSAEDVKKHLAEQKDSSNTLMWSPEYRLTLMKRDYPPQTSSEMHEDMTQIYWMVGGTGALALGGEPEKKTQRWAGQWGGEGQLKGTRIQRVKAGDVLAIAAGTWHQSQPDQGGFCT